MEVIQGKHCFRLDQAAFAARIAGFSSILIDIGTGDGRFVRHVAQAEARCLAIGVDACRENLRDSSRRAPGNTLFAIANADALPVELTDRATWLTINFPWGSLLRGLVEGAPALLESLWAVTRPGAALEVRLNGGALGEAGWTVERGASRVRAVMLDAGFDVELMAPMDRAALRACPTTWARRILFGRDPRAVYLRALRPDSWRSYGSAPGLVQVVAASV